MVRIEYDKVEIEVPESWDDITLGFYETFYAEKPGTTRERAAYVAKICRTDADWLLSRPVEVFNRIVEYIGFLFKDNPVSPVPYVETGGVRYTVPVEDEMSLGAWADADEIQKKGENILSNILAVVCRPAGEVYDYKNNETRRAMFAALPVGKVLGVLAFFLRCKTVSDQRTVAYTKLARAYGRLPQNIKPFPSPGAGIRLSRIWPALKYYVLMRLLNCRLRKFLRSCNTVKTKIPPTRHNKS